MSSSETTANAISDFMERHISGWIKENDILELISDRVKLQNVFECVSRLQNPAQLDVVVRFLENAVRHEKIATMITDPAHRSYLVDALNSPSDRLRTVVLDAYSNSSPQVPVDVELAIRLLCDEDTGISQRTIRLIVSRSSTDLSLTQSLINHYKSNTLGEVEKFRFIETFIHLGRCSRDQFNLVQSSGSLDPIITSFLANDSDLLVKLGSLTLIESLAAYDAGREYLGSSGILLQLEKELSGPLADSTTVISLMYTIASILPFVATSQSEQVRYLLYSAASKFSPILSEFIISVNNAERMCAFKVLGQLATGTFSEPIETYLRKNWKLFNQLQYAVLDTDVEVVNASLDSLHAVIKSWESNMYMESESAQGSLVEIVLETFKRHPFVECRCLVYSLLSVMMEDLTMSVLAKLLSDPSPIRTALLDYKSESNYDSRRAKCDFVRVLVKMEEKNVLRKFFTKEQVENFIDYAEQGLEWVPITEAKSEMETEAV